MSNRNKRDKRHAAPHCPRCVSRPGKGRVVGFCSGCGRQFCENHLRQIEATMLCPECATPQEWKAAEKW